MTCKLTDQTPRPLYTVQQCDDGGFACPDKCIPSGKVCDGTADCFDNADEADCPGTVKCEA